MCVALDFFSPGFKLRDFMLKSHIPANGNPLDLEVSRLRKTYSSEPLVIDGIVGESPQSDMPSRVHGGGYRVHLFTLAAWKPDDGELQTDDLVVSRAIPNSASSRYQLNRFCYHRLRVLLSADQKRAVLLEGVECQDCPQELAALAESLAKPFALQHERFGSLMLDRGLNLFSGITTWNGAKVELSLPAEGEQLDHEISKRAESLFDNEDEIARRVCEFLVTSIVSEHDEDLTASEIQTRITLEGIELSECGSEEFWHSDDDLWGGHSLVVRLMPDDQMTFAVEG